jgi:hypothetical protein
VTVSDSTRTHFCMSCLVIVLSRLVLGLSCAGIVLFLCLSCGDCLYLTAQGRSSVCFVLLLVPVSVCLALVCPRLSCLVIGLFCVVIVFFCLVIVLCCVELCCFCLVLCCVVLSFPASTFAFVYLCVCVCVCLPILRTFNSVLMVWADRLSVPNSGETLRAIKVLLSCEWLVLVL